MHEARSDQDFNPTHQRLNSGVLWALGVPSTTAEVAAAHDEAVQATVAFLERTAVKARTGHNGVHQVDVVALRNRYDLGLLNAASGTVRSIRPETRSLLVQLDRGAERRVPMDYLADGHLTHGYATTIHKAQGLTCDEAFVYADESLYREAGYTALSRARHQTLLYLATSDHSRNPAPHVTQSRAQRLAIDHRDRRRGPTRQTRVPSCPSDPLATLA